MKKEQLITLVREEIMLFADTLTVMNVEEISEKLKGQIGILDAIAQASFAEHLFDATKKTEAESGQVLKESNQLPVQSTKLVEAMNAEETCIHGYFTKHLRGGSVHQKAQIYVPEKIIRELSLETGDFVKATRLLSKANKSIGLKKVKHSEYHYEIVKKNMSKAPPIRKVESMLPIQKHTDLDNFFVEFKDVVNDMAIIALIQENDLLRFRLKEGDIVDYAHEVNNCIHGKVIWKHKILPLNKIEAEKNFSIHKTKSKQKKNTFNTHKVQAIFDKLAILTIGGTNRNIQKGIREEILKRAGTCECLSGDEPKQTMIAKIKKADLIAVFTQSISHEAMYLAKHTCKKYEKTVTYTKNTGSIALIRRLSMMKKKLNKEYR